MNFLDLIHNIDADLYRRFKTAVEIGRWPDGRTLTEQQKELTLQAIIAYEVKHLPPEQRTGYIVRNTDVGNTNSACSSANDSDNSNIKDFITPLKWRDEKDD